MKAALVVLIVLALRLPFLNHPIQGDDVYYLEGAQHAQIEPLHPNNVRYVFLGDLVDMRGHPHPPLNAWVLGALLALVGDIREVPFHAAYLLFSLLAALAMWWLARRFSDRPLGATLAFCAVPAFVVNGNSLESDLPFLAFWMAGMALFVTACDRGSIRWVLAAFSALALAAMTAYQAALAVPILAVYLWLNRRRWLPGWVALAAVPLLMLGWQAFERSATGEVPLEVLSGHFTTYGLQSVQAKLRNAVALTAHLGAMLFPLLALALARQPRWVWVVALAGAAGGAGVDAHPLFWAPFGLGVAFLTAIAVQALRACRIGERDLAFLGSWLLVFFAGALALFFAGSARYLLPLAAPLAILAVEMAGRTRWMAPAIAAQLVLSVSLAVANYQHWEGYRQFAASLAEETASKRLWINGEWGLRFYFEADGGLPVRRGQAVLPGDLMVTSDLAYPIPVTTGGGVAVPLAEREIRPWLPLRLIGLGAKSAYSTAGFGFRPFDLNGEPADVVRALAIQEQAPTLSRLPMNAPEADHQIVSGVYQVEEGGWRWMGGRGVFHLKSPEQPAPVEVALFLPDAAPGREVTVEVDGRIAAHRTLEGPGGQRIATPPVKPDGPVATVVVRVDRTFSVPGDHRQLGIIVSEVGFGEPEPE